MGIPITVVVAERLAQSALEGMIHAGLDVQDFSKLDRNELLDRMADVQALLIRSQTQVNRELLDSAKALKIVGRAGTGVDNIDVGYARSRGVVVVNAPGANAISVAEHTLGHILGVARRIGEGTVGLKKGLWQKKALSGIELYGKTLGLVGLGRIGKEVALRAKAFGMTVLAYDPYITEDMAQESGVSLVSFEGLCQDADVLSLHLPVTAETRNMVNAEVIARMKPGVIIVNCARGGLIDEVALEDALNAGKVFGVGLDVFADEPSPRPSLIGHPRVVSTPHIAASTPEAEERAGGMVAEEVVAWSKGQPLRYVVE